MPNVKLQSPNGEIFEVDIEIIICSITIRAMLENLSIYEEEVGVVPLLNINPAILNKIIQRATYHKDDPPPPPEDDEDEEYSADDIDSYYADFVKVIILCRLR